MNPPSLEEPEGSVSAESSGDVIHVSGNIVNSTIIIKSVVRDEQVVDLEKLPPEDGEPPYQGLQYFSERDAGRFFGREQLTARVIGRLQRTRFLAVVGASGSGKSSLVRAGVVPALKSGGRLPDGSLPPADSAKWLYRILIPGGHPLDALAAALAREGSLPGQINSLRDELARDPKAITLAAQSLLAGEDRPHLLIVVDQFEEVFTQTRSAEEQEAFLQALVAASNPNDQHPVSLILCLRADFYAQVAQHDSLRELVSQHQEFIGAMSRSELVDAVIAPLNLGNWRIQEGLVKVILDDVGYEPGALPLLSHALLETWKRRRGRTLTLSGYVECGGVHGAIRETAEAVFQQRLTSEQRPIARLIFLHLAELNADAQDTRRRASFSELVTRSTDELTIQTVINILVEARLVITSTSTQDGAKVVEVAHESLIREWPTLRQWLSEDRQGLILHQQLTEAAEDWLKDERDASLLFRGRRLAQIREWAETGDNADLLSLAEVEFLEASQASAKLEQENEARLRRLKTTQRVFALVIASLLLLVGVFGYLGLRPSPPPVMNGLYNIAIAEVAEIGADGQIHPIANGDGVKLSQTIAAALRDALQGNTSILVWNDSPELKQRRVEIGRVDGDPSAVSLAKRLNADMVIYGVLDQRQQPPVLTIQMYLAPRLSDALDEVDGGFSLNNPIPVPADLEADSVKAALTRQTNLLALLALGQSNSALGFTLEALESYLKAEELAPESDLIQFFIGREYLFSLEREQALQVARDAFEQKAGEAFQKSLELNPQNARAYIGMGSLYLKQAKRLILDGRNSEFTEQGVEQIQHLLDQAEASYGTVLQLDLSSARYGVPMRELAELSLGDTQVSRASLLLATGQNEAAVEPIDQAIRMLEATLPAFQAPGLSRYLAQNYQFLGNAYQNSGYIAYLGDDNAAALLAYQKALAQFDACLALGATSNDRVIQSDIVGQVCKPLRQETEQLIQTSSGGP
jgi:energy-coupling factor transporter ATP-binding protein EcfA2